MRVWKHCKIKFSKNTPLNSKTEICFKMERKSLTVNFNFDVQVRDSEFIFMAGCIVFKLDDVVFTILKRPNKIVELVQHKF